MPGPLEGVRIIEIAGIGPGPFAAMLLADLGADVVRIDRASAVQDGGYAGPSGDLTTRNKRSVGVDLKHPDGVELVLRLVEGADALVEGFRPGVAERLGVGPDASLERNPRLVYGRMTGWGQTGPLAHAAGHDINYIALTGALAAIGPHRGPPVVPLNLVGDYGGGGAFLALGVVCALWEARASGRGQVVDAAMVDGATTLMTVFHAQNNAGVWSNERGTNMLDGGAHFYGVYECADGRYVSIGAIEPQFYAELLDKVGLADDPDMARQRDRSAWPQLRQRLADRFRTRTREEWCEILEGSEACFAPVLTIDEVADHPHHVARGTLVDVDGVRQPAPAPRFDRTPGEIWRPPAHPGEHTAETLRDIGVSEDEVRGLRASGAVR